MHTLRQRKLGASGVCLALALVAGCATQSETTVSSPAAPAASSVASGSQDAEAADVISLLGYFQRVSALSGEELRREYNSVNQAFTRDKTENQRLKLAMLLSVPGTAFRDDTRLLNLLEASPLRNAPIDSPQRELLTLLQKLTADRVRLAGQAKEEQRRVEAQARDEQKRLEQQIKDDQKRLEQQVKDEQRRADELQQKLDALLAIDRELRQRSPQRGTHRGSQPQ